MLVVIAWAESDGLVRPHKARLGISPGLWPKGLDIKHPLGHHEHVTTWPKVIRRPKTLGLLSTLSVSSVHRYIGAMEATLGVLYGQLRLSTQRVTPHCYSDTCPLLLPVLTIQKQGRKKK